MNKILSKIEAEKTTIKKINLSERYDMTEVPEMIRECLNLEELDISYTGITEIPDFVFQLPRLKGLSYMACTALKEQPAGLTHAGNLEELSLWIGPGQHVPSAVAGLKNLKTLVLSGEISELPEHVLTLTGLEALEFFDTRVRTIPGSISRLSSLKKISFWQPLFGGDERPVALELDVIFENLVTCKNLRELKLDRNGIKKIPQNISLLKQLHSFSAPNNELTSFPGEIYELTNLKELDLGVNQLKTIPVGIEKLVNLKTLKLNSNWKNALDTTNLFSVIDKLENLETLELWSCQSIKALPESISRLKKLKKLDVDNNLIKALPDSIFEMTHLKWLRISTNKIPAQQVEKLQRTLTTTKILA